MFCLICLLISIRMMLDHIGGNISRHLCELCVCVPLVHFLCILRCAHSMPPRIGVNVLPNMPSNKHKDDVGSHWWQHLTSFVRVVCVCPACSFFVYLEVCPFDAPADWGECFA